MMNTVILQYAGEVIILPMSGQVITENDLRKDLTWWHVLLVLLLGIFLITCMMILFDKLLEEIDAERCTERDKKAFEIQNRSTNNFLVDFTELQKTEEKRLIMQFSSRFSRLGRQIKKRRLYRLKNISKKATAAI